MDPQYQQPLPQPPQQPAYTGNSLEYLNQISSNKPPIAPFLNKKILAIGGAVLVLIIILVVVAVSSGNKPATTNVGTTLGYRIAGLNELVAFGETSTINDSGLRKALAETKIIALSEQYQIGTIVTLPKLDAKTPIPASESVAETVATLGKAVATGNFNRNYADAMITQIEKITSALRGAITKDTSRATITKIEENIAEYEAIIERLANY